MALTRLPEIVCYNCKRPKDVAYHGDGSIRSIYCHDCPNRPPGPASYPVLFEKGKFRIEPTKEGFRVYSARARAESDILRHADSEERGK